MKYIIPQEYLVALSNYRYGKYNKKLITGTHLAAFAGKDEYGQTPEHKMLERLGVYKKDIAEYYGKAGTKLEPIIRSVVSELTQKQIICFDAEQSQYDNFKHDKNFGGLVDGYIVENGVRTAIWECKTTGVQNAHKWMHTIPENYRIQVLLYMYLSNIKEAYISVAFLGKDVYSYDLESQYLNSYNKYRHLTNDDIYTKTEEELKDCVWTKTVKYVMQEDDFLYIKALMQTALDNISRIVNQGYIELNPEDTKDAKVIEAASIYGNTRFADELEVVDKIIDITEQSKLLDKQLLGLYTDLYNRHEKEALENGKTKIILHGTNKKITISILDTKEINKAAMDEDPRTVEINTIKNHIKDSTKDQTLVIEEMNKLIEVITKDDMAKIEEISKELEKEYVVKGHKAKKPSISKL